ncbi:hypothetical protein BAY61_21805 [Prauserella marina]|nr:hypothetical protein BAY61_21805 [Prauserella marina]
MLVVARTPAAVSRLADVTPLLLEDPRLEVTFVVDRGSAFSGAVDGRLTKAGALLLNWETAIRTRFDLALAASDNGDLGRILAPLVLLAHGAGYHRHSAAEPGAISGIRGSTLVESGRAVPHTVTLAHPDQLETVKAVHSELALRARVIGDPCLDRIIASLPLRRRYRRAFGASGTTVVTICSTWGPRSLFGRLRNLPETMVTALPSDAYRVVLVLHPNVWQRHGELQIRAWLRRATDAGLIVVPPEEGWRAALVAADLVVSDHGSLTCYATALNTPVLIAADGGAEVVDDSPLAELLALLPRLNPGAPLRAQLEETIARGAVGGDFPGRMFANQGRAAAILRTLMYDILELPESPGTASVRPLPSPAAAIIEPLAFDVAVKHLDRTGLTLERYPCGPATPPGFDHVAASEIAPDPGLIERAAVIWSADPHDDLPSALRWTTETLTRYPGARVAVTETADAVIAQLRSGETVTCHGGLSRAAAGSAIHRWSLTTRAARPGTVRVNIGATSATLTITT